MYVYKKKGRGKAVDTERKKISFGQYLVSNFAHQSPSFFTSSTLDECGIGHTSDMELGAMRQEKLNTHLTFFKTPL